MGSKWNVQTAVAIWAACVVVWAIFGYVQSKGDWTSVLGAGLIAGTVTWAILFAINRSGRFGPKPGGDS